MRVGIARSDVPACLLFRALGPAQALASKREIELTMIDDFRLRMAVRKHRKAEPVGLIDFPDVDVVVLVRGAFSERIHQVIPLIQREGIAVVIDYDDAYDRLPPALYSLYKISPGQNPYYNWRHAVQAAKLADLVAVSTPPLTRYRSDAVVLKNCVPLSYLRVGERSLVKKSGNTVGWGGTVYGHPYDLDVPGGGVSEALRRTGARFLNVGDGVRVKSSLGLDNDPDVSGIVATEDYPEHMALIDVAIAPLHDSDYTHSKSHLKMIESLALGSQVVASPTQEYRTLQDELQQWCTDHESPVPAHIACKPRQWRNGLVAALKDAQDPDKRARLARSAMSFVRERYCLGAENARCYDWAEAWEQATKNRRSRGVIA